MRLLKISFIAMLLIPFLFVTATVMSSIGELCYKQPDRCPKEFYMLAETVEGIKQVTERLLVEEVNLLRQIVKRCNLQERFETFMALQLKKRIR